MEKGIILRRIDELGRVCLPREAYAQIGVRPGDTVAVVAGESGIVLRRHTAGCVRCGSAEGLVEVTRGVYLCRACAKALAGEEETI